MDTDQIPVHRLTIGALLLLLPLAGCGPRRAPGSQELSALKGQLNKKLEEQKQEIGKTPSLTVQATKGNRFTIDDAEGRRVLEADVASFASQLRSGAGLQGPVNLKQAKCRLFQDGKPQWVFTAPTAVWDGERLIASETAHAVSTDGAVVIDAKKATWTAQTARMALEEARLESKRQQQAGFVAEGPRADVVDRLVHLPAGASARNSEGRQLRADRVRWHLESGQLEADGRVVLIQEGTRVAGQRLRANTRLRSGRLSGGTRVQLQRLPGARG